MGIEVKSPFVVEAAQGVFPAYVVDSRYVPGNVFWVQSTSANAGDSAGKGRSPSSPCSTIDYAVGLCTAGQGDVIIALPGHVDTLTAANACDLDVAGIKLLGIGEGSLKPTVKFSGAVGASFRVNANDVRVENIRFMGVIDNVTTCVTVNGKTDVTFKDCEYLDTAATQCAKFFHAANNSDRLTIDGFRYVGDAAAGTTHAFTFDGCDDLVMKNFLIKGNFSTAAVAFITTLSARVDVRQGQVWNQNSADVCFLDTITGSTGQFSDLKLTMTDNAANITEAITGATFHVDGDNVWCVNAVNEKAMLINWTASTDA